MSEDSLCAVFSQLIGPSSSTGVTGLCSFKLSSSSRLKPTVVLVVVFELVFVGVVAFVSPCPK